MITDVQGSPSQSFFLSNFLKVLEAWRWGYGTPHADSLGDVAERIAVERRVSGKLYPPREVR